MESIILKSHATDNTIKDAQTKIDLVVVPCIISSLTLSHLVICPRKEEKPVAKVVMTSNKSKLPGGMEYAIVSMVCETSR